MKYNNVEMVSNAKHLNQKTNQQHTLRHSQSSKHPHPGVSHWGGVVCVVVPHSIVGPVTQPQVLTDERNVLDEVDCEDNDAVSPAHGTEVLEVHWKLHLDVWGEKKAHKQSQVVKNSILLIRLTAPALFP